MQKKAPLITSEAFLPLKLYVLYMALLTSHDVENCYEISNRDIVIAVYVRIAWNRLTSHCIQDSHAIGNGYIAIKIHITFEGSKTFYYYPLACNGIAAGITYSMLVSVPHGANRRGDGMIILKDKVVPISYTL